jgi:hypothetical protein
MNILCRSLTTVAAPRSLGLNFGNQVINSW